MTQILRAGSENPKRYQLYFTIFTAEGTIENRVAQIVADPVKIGRGRDLFQVRDAEASRCHGEFFVASGKLFYRDLGSRNGSYLNEMPVTQSAMKLRDRIRMGNTVLRLDRFEAKLEGE